MYSAIRREESRKRSRLASTLSITVQKETMGTDIRGTIRDLNWYGAGLELDNNVNEGDLLYLSIPIPDSDQVLKTRGKVVWSRESEKNHGKTCCGIYFLMEPDAVS